MTAHQLQELLLASLMRKHGGNRRRWRTALGPIRIYDLATHPHCNWSVQASGTVGENSAIERLLDDIRGVHSLVQAD